MAKTSTFRKFMAALKKHWRTALPTVKPLRERCGPLPMASSFDAGVIQSFGQRVYLEFQTTWKEAGYFTVNLIVADSGQEISTITQSRAWKPGEKLTHGGHRIGNFVGDQRHDKWWHLCDVERGGLGDDPEYWTKLRLGLREGNWTAADYADEEAVIKSAVGDLTRDVRAALNAIGVIYGTE